MSGQLIVQCNYIIYFHIRRSFFNSFWKRVLDSKEIVNLQGLFVLTIINVDIKTYIHQQSIIILLKEYILFIGCLYYFSVQFNSCYFYIRVMESWRYKRDYLHASIDISLQI